MWKSVKVAAALSGILFLGLTGCGQKQPAAVTPKGPSAASQGWKRLTDAFMKGYFDSRPFFAAQSGRHEYDGQLSDLSNHGIRRDIAWLHDLFWMEKAKFPFTNPRWYIDKIDPDMYLNRNYAPLDVRMKAYIKYARGIPKMANDIKANLQSPLPKTYVELGIAQFGGLAEFYSKNVGPVFASVSDPDLQKQLSDANAAAAQAMEGLKQTLVEARKQANDKFAMGPELYAQMVTQTELVNVSVDQIEAAGRADLDRNTAALKSECDTYAPKASLLQCAAKVSAHKPKDGPLDAARAQLALLKDFIVKNNVVSIPSAEEALVAEAPVYKRSNAAFIEVPGPFDHGVASVYFISPPDSKWSKTEQAAYIPSEATLLFTSVHEVWPGHFLQFLHSNANPTKLEALWVGYAFAEGWAHYCEEMMYEKGLGKGDPEKHIGQLTDALLRDVRLLSSVGLHTHGMTVAQSEKMFREQAFQDPGNARQQAARGTFDPAYLNYTLGKLMIRKLRSDWTAKQPGSGSATPPADEQALWHDFHDKFLSYGGPPIPLLRKEMLGEEGSVL